MILEVNFTIIKEFSGHEKTLKVTPCVQRKKLVYYSKIRLSMNCSTIV